MQQPMKLEQSKEPTPEEIPGGSETILLVEDEEMLNELVKTILETRGYKVIAARDGEEAIEKYTLHQQEIGLVLCDLGLPKVSGDEVLARLRALNPTVRFILASGHIEPEMKSQLLRDGAKAVIQKPYHPNEILRTIRSILDQK
jgi:DNA-binding response OmpR family regulator